MSTTAPLRRAFLGPALAAAQAAPSVAGQARFDGCLAMSLWPRADVERLLPSDLVLAPRADTAAAAPHPVLALFGEHLDSGLVIAGLLLPMGIRYWEFCLAIPYVAARGGRHLHTYVARMYSSYFPAVWTSNAHYGFAKAQADMRWEGPLFVVTAPGGALLWHAAVESDAAWQRGDASGLAPLAEALALPMAGRRADGTWLESYFQLDFGAALLRPTRARLSVDAPLVEGLAPRLDYALPGAALQVQGMLWRLTHPGPCHW